MTAGDPLYSEPGSAKRAVFGQRIDGILAARGVEAALASEDPTEGDSVEEDELDEEPAQGVRL
jgi:hypothetical protein